MMEERYLLVMRHAKSDWSVGGQPDFERDLNERGRKAAPKMGAFLTQSGYKPEQIIASPASRAKQTAKLVLEGADVAPDALNFDENLYYGSPEDYLEAARSLDESNTIGLLVGHNPLVEQFISMLCAGRGQSAVIMPTAGVACLEIMDVSWEKLSPGGARLKWFMIPRLLDKLQP